MRIALLEDDVIQAQHMQVWLEASGHVCTRFSTGESFLNAVAKDSYDLLILDWMLPDINGDEVLRWVRENLDWQIPVIFITVRDSEQDIVHALEQGADDYMSKPVKPLEMLARITALGRRAKVQAENSKLIEIGPYTLDLARRTITRDDEVYELTHKEFDLAAFLLRNVGRLLSRKHLMESVWGQRADLNTRTVDTHISRVRSKLGFIPDNGWRLSAIYQHGYRLERLDQADEPIGHTA